MAGDELGLIAQGPEPLGDGIEQLLMVAAGKICPPDRALEQHIADQRQMAGGMVEDNMAGCVARAMIDIEHQPPDCHLIALHQPAIGGEGFAAAEAIAQTILFIIVDDGLVADMRAFDGYAQFFSQNAGLAAMVEMAVGDEQFLNLHTKIARGRLKIVQIPAGVDKSPFHRLGAPQKGAILLQRGDGDDAALQTARLKSL